MGSCVTKAKAQNNIIKVNPVPGEQLKVSEDIKLSQHPSIKMTRKNLKQKKAVVDARIRPQNITDAPTAKIIEKSKSSQDIKVIKSCLQKHFIFSGLTDDQKSIIIEQMKMYIVNSNEIIFNQGSQGSAFFIIASGRLDVLVNENKVNSLKAGDSFGELALIHDTPRTATIKTVLNSTMWVLDRRTFRSILEELNAKNYQENHQFIESIPLFKILSSSQKESLVSCLTVLNFTIGQRIVNEGDSGELLYIIKEGTVSCSQKGKEIRKMGKGDYFGEQALIYDSVRTASVIALEDVTCVALNREEFSNALGASLQQIMYKNSMRIAFDKSEVCKKLNKQQKENLINEMEVQSFDSGMIVIPLGTQKKDAMLIIVKGELRNIKNKDATYKVFDVIGDAALIEDSSEVYKEEYIAKGEVDIAHISNSGFFNAIGGDYLEVTNNNEAIELLKRVQLFRGLSAAEFNILASHVKIQEYNDGDIIVEQNNPGDCFFLIKSGKVDVIKDSQVIRTITKNDYFGERSLLFDNFRSASIVAKQKVVC